MNLKDIVPNFISEDRQFECKGRLDRDDILGWLKTIDGFANAKGGILYLGVKDKSYDLIGFEEPEIDKEKLFLFNTMSQHFPFLPPTQVIPLPYSVNGKQRYLMQVEVGESERKPLILKYKEMPMVFLRRDGFTNPATEEELHEMAISSSRPAFDMQLSQTLFDEKDFTKLYSFYEKRNDGSKLTRKKLAAISFFNDDGLLRRGACLFADGYEGDEGRIVCSSYRGFTRGDDAIVASNSFKGNLIDAYNFAFEFIDQRMNHGFVKLPTSRVDMNSYKERVIFEAVINALAHRDYFLQGTQISVDLFPNRLVISSPGSLYGVGELKATYGLESIISKRRNELISDVFVLCKAMEAKGTGLEKIKAEYKGQDARHQPFIFSKNNQFSIVLPDLTYASGVSIAEEALTILKPMEGKSRFDLDLLSFCYGEPKGAKEIANHLGLSDSSFLRKEIIGSLVKEELLLEEGNRNKKYLTNRKLVALR